MIYRAICVERHGRGAVTADGAEVEYPEVVGLHDSVFSAAVPFAFLQQAIHISISEAERRHIPVGRGKQR